MKLHVIVSIKLGREGGPWATSHFFRGWGVGKEWAAPYLVGKVTLFVGQLPLFELGTQLLKKILYIGYFFLVYTCQSDNMNYQIIMSGINQQRRF